MIVLWMVFIFSFMLSNSNLYFFSTNHKYRLYDKGEKGGFEKEMIFAHNSSLYGYNTLDVWMGIVVLE